MTLRLIPPNGDGAEPDKKPSAPPSHQQVSDGEALENRVTLQRLADRLICMGPPGTEIVAPDPGQIVVVFDAEALPELASLLYRRQS